MNDPWVVFPSADYGRGELATQLWRRRGYRVLAFVDKGERHPSADHVMEGEFPGYYRIINHLADEAVIRGAEVVTCIGDDMTPDQNYTAQQIAAEYLAKFPNGDGVLQATGDMQGVDSSGIQASARICGSPTFGRGWITGAYGGKGPLFSGYHSYYADEDLWNVAQRLGLLWLEPRFTFLHQHWSFGWSDQTHYQKRNSDHHWQEDRILFYDRQSRGFPNSEMLNA